jgi:transposase
VSPRELHPTTMDQTASISSRKTSVGREECSSAPVTVEQAASAGKAYDVIKVAIDVHGQVWVASRQIDGSTPQAPVKFGPADCLKFIARQVGLARRVVCCYEAGCFGYAPYRQIVALGAECLVVAPQDWDERNKNVRTDKTDTAAMVNRLDRYVAGNKKALAVVRVPGEAEELARSRVREREQFLGARNAWANRGKSLLLEYGLPASWGWWKPGNWEKLRAAVRERKPQLAEQVLAILGDFRDMITAASEKLESLTAEQQKRQKERNERAKAAKVKGIGELSMAKIEAEVGDWKRFNNRRQVASYTGLCPGVSGTAGSFVNLSVNKCGNRRLRAVLVELAWLLPRYQPRYLPLARWKAVLSGTNRSAKKKAVVALARRLAVDLWRINTGRTTPEALGLERAA